MVSKKWFKVSFMAATLVTIVAFWSISAVVYTQSNTESCDDATVGVVKIHGFLDMTEDYVNYQLSADDIIGEIERYSQDPGIEVILIDIYSPGGSMTAADEISRAIKRSQKRVIALIREEGESAAYLVASAADEVYAGKYSLVGNIGINGSLLSRVEKNKKEGLEYIDLASVPFKDIYNPDRPLSPEDKQKIQDTTDAHHVMFVEAVAENRNMDAEEMFAIADGTIYTAEQALQYGLIDKVGDMQSVYADLAEEGVAVHICSGL